LALFFGQFVRDQAWTAFAAIVTTAITDQGFPPALESAQADADLTAGTDQACTSGMGLADQLDRVAPVTSAGQPSASSEQKAWLTDTSARPAATERVSVDWVGREP
jgi:hypothetical protein